MIDLRRPFWTQFGTSLAGVALCVQLMLASAGLLQPPASNAPADIFGGHALCLGAGDGSAPVPAGERAPAGGPHHHVGLCCLWHPVPAIQPIALTAPQPVIYANIARAERFDESGASVPWQSPHNARAPPAIV